MRQKYGIMDQSDVEEGREGTVTGDNFQTFPG